MKYIYIHYSKCSATIQEKFPYVVYIILNGAAAAVSYVLCYTYKWITENA